MTILTHFHHLEEAMNADDRGDRFFLASWDLKEQIEALRSSVKWFIGEVDSLPRSKPITVHSFPRSPYPLCSFDMCMQSAADTVMADVLCVVVDEHEKLTFRCYEKPIGSGTVIDGQWLEAGEVVMDRESGAFRSRHLNARTENDDVIQYYVPWKESFEDLQPSKILPWPDEVGANEKWLRHVALTLGTFLGVLNCVNVSTETIEAQKFLNNKRLSKGKPPIYSYKTLVLRPNSAQRIDRGGTHESPRIHLRRGHIKNRKTGNFWWQPCVVGERKRGVVMKDYRADQLVSA